MTTDRTFICGTPIPLSNPHFLGKSMISGFLELADPMLLFEDAHGNIANNFGHQKLQKPKSTDFIYCGPVLGIGKRPSIWLNLDFLESLGSKEWEKWLSPGF